MPQVTHHAQTSASQIDTQAQDIAAAAPRPIYEHLSSSINKQSYDLWQAQDRLAHFKLMQGQVSDGIDNLSGQACINFGSNDYLGLRWDPRTIEAATKAIKKMGTGSGASPLMCGNSTLHNELEEQLADWLQCESALLFASGYQANLGALSAVLTNKMVAVTEAGVHASIIDGVLLSGARFRRFRRDRLQRLQQLLTRSEQSTWVIAETLYSMEGDMLDLETLVERYNTAASATTGLYIDEAHTLGVFGTEGAGLVRDLAQRHSVDLVMGTLSKSLGSTGGFVAGSRELINALKVNARALLFSASGTPAAAGAALATLQICRSEPERRTRVLTNALRLRQGFAELQLDIGDSHSQIVPIHVGESLAAVDLANQLFKRGVYASVALHPAVPMNKALLRFGVTAAHTTAQIDRCVETVAKLMPVGES